LPDPWAFFQKILKTTQLFAAKGDTYNFMDVPCLQNRRENSRLKMTLIHKLLYNQRPLLHILIGSYPT
jgi:hypothetical protein